MSNSESTEKNDTSNSFAERLAGLMAARGLTQKQLGAAIDVAQASVFKWLNGTMPRSGELYRLAKYFGVTMEWLLDGVNAQAAAQEILDSVDPMALPADAFKAFLLENGMTPAEYLESVTRMTKVHELLAEMLQGKKTGVDTLKEIKDYLRVRLTWSQLKQRLIAATKPPGKRAELARAIGVKDANINSWLVRDVEPGAEATFRLLEWVTAEEAKPKAQPRKRSK